MTEKEKRKEHPELFLIQVSFLSCVFFKVMEKVADVHRDPGIVLLSVPFILILSYALAPHLGELLVYGEEKVIGVGEEVKEKRRLAAPSLDEQFDFYVETVDRLITTLQELEKNALLLQGMWYENAEEVGELRETCLDREIDLICDLREQHREYKKKRKMLKINRNTEVDFLKDFHLFFTEMIERKYRYESGIFSGYITWHLTAVVEHEEAAYSLMYPEDANRTQRLQLSPLEKLVNTLGKDGEVMRMRLTK